MLEMLWLAKIKISTNLNLDFILIVLKQWNVSPIMIYTIAPRLLFALVFLGVAKYICKKEKILNPHL